MRAAIPSAVVGLVALLTPDVTQRYVVLPLGHAIDAGIHPCRAALSADGTIVAFDALTAFDAADANRRPDVYVLDRATQQLTLISRTPTGAAGRGSSRCPSMSADGRIIAFESDATDLVGGDLPGTSDVFVFDRLTAKLLRITPPSDAGPTMSARAALSADGRVVVFDATAAEPTPGQKRRVYRATVDTPGAVEDLGEGYAATTSGDGSVVAFVTSAGIGSRQSLRVLTPHGERTVGQPSGRSAEGDAYAPSLSVDGRWIAYVFKSATARAGQSHHRRTQVFAEEVGGGQRLLVSTTQQSREANGLSGPPVIDATGAHVVFESTASNLGCGSSGTPACDSDLNLLADVFVWDRAMGSATRLNVPTHELVWLEGGSHPTISADGCAVAFLSRQPVSHADGRDTFDLFLTQRLSAGTRTSDRRDSLPPRVCPEASHQTP